MHQFAMEWLSVVLLSDTAEHDSQPIVKGYHGFPSLPETWPQSKVIVRACRPSQIFGGGCTGNTIYLYKCCGGGVGAAKKNRDVYM